MAYSPEEVERLAREWVDAVNSGTGPSGGWRLQLLRRRTRRDFSGYAPESGETRERQRNIDGKKVLVDANGDPVAYKPVDPPEGGLLCDELPVRIRRFVAGCPWALADAVVRRLHRIAPYTGILWNGVRIEGTYRPTRTELVRDEQSQSPGERGSLGTYTIVQDLLEVTACEDVLDVASGASCTAEEAVAYRWDADTVEGVPPDGYTGCEQGVAWAVRAVQRNEEGSFDYQVVKTVAKTTSWGPVEIECNAQYRTTERGWRNLYGEGTDASPWEARPCGGEASPAELPPPECDSCGVKTTLQVQKNQDCTYDVVVRTREVVKPVVDGWTQGTACRPETVTSVKNSCEEPAVPVPAPGERVTARIDRNDDDTWSSEIRVLSAEEELEYGWTDGPACRPRTVSVRENLRARPDIPAVNPGETMDASLTRTEDCLWNLRTSVTAAREPVSYDFTEGSQCRPVDVSIRQAQPSQPSPSEFAPGPGETVNATVTRNEDCTWDWRREVSRAQAPEDISWTEGSQCRETESHSMVSQASYEGKVPRPGAGERVSASVSRNPDCTYDIQYKVTKPAPDGVDTWHDGTCAQATEHVLHTDVAEIVDPGAGRPGQAVSASWTRNEDCTYTGRVSTTTSTPDAQPWTEGSQCRAVEAKAMWNQPSVDIPPPGRGERVSASVSRNADCTYASQYKVTKPATGGPDSWSDGTCAQTTRHTLYSDVAAITSPGPGGAGTAVSASWTRNEDCTYTGRVSTTTSTPDAQPWTEGSQCRAVEAKAMWNQPSVDIPSPGRGERVSASVSRNADCTYDVQYRVTKPATGGPDSWSDGTCAQTTKHTLYSDVAAITSPGPGGAGTAVSASWTRNEDCTDTGRVSRTTSHGDSAAWTEGTSCRVTDAHAAWNQRGVSIPAPGQGQRVSASVSRNADCTYDIQYRVTKPATGGPDSWSDGTCAQTTEHTLYSDVAAIAGSGPGGAGTAVSASWTKNEDCTYTGRVSRTTSHGDSTAWTEGTSCRVTDAHAAWNQLGVSIPAAGQGQRVSASVSRNADCTFDYTYKVTNPATGGADSWSDGTCAQTTEHTLYSDVAAIAGSGPGGAGTAVSASWTKNEDCTYTGRVSRTTSHGDSTAWTEGTSCRVTDAHAAWNQLGVSIPAAGQGQRVSASVSRNADCTFDYTYKVTNPATGGADSWSDGTCAQTTEHTLYSDVAAITSPGPGGAGTAVSASWTKNEDCTYSGRISRTTSEEKTAKWDEGSCLNPGEGFSGRHMRSYDMIPAPDGSTSVDARVSANDDCTYDVSYTVRRAEPHDTDWITWDSETKAKDGSVAYFHHGLRVFYNLDTVPTPPRGSNVTLDVHLNEFCKYDGKMMYSDLYDWYDPRSEIAGIQKNNWTKGTRIADNLGRIHTVKESVGVIVYYGPGHEGSEANEASEKPGYAIGNMHVYYAPVGGGD